MICKSGRVILLLALGFNLLTRVQAVEVAPADLQKTATNSTPALLKPGPDAGKIAFVTAFMMEKLQYLQHPFDATISAKVFDEYLTSLDPQHVHFLQSDLEEFAGYRTNLARLTLNRSGVSDTYPAFEIFNRYMDRLRQHVAYVDELLKTEKFNFTSDERILLDRKNAPYPKDLNAAKKLWAQRLRYEFLMEKVNRETQKTNSTDTAKSGKSSPPKSMHDQIVDTLSKNYHRMLKVFADYDSRDVLNDYLEWFARSYDPHSDYEGPMDYEDFAMQMNLSLFGIGAELRSEDGYCKIEVLLNGPAK